MNKFLEEFTYKDEIGPSIFLIGLGSNNIHCVAYGRIQVDKIRHSKPGEFFEIGIE